MDGAPNTPGGTTSMSTTVYLNRHTGLDRTCRIKFNMKIGNFVLIPFIEEIF